MEYSSPVVPLITNITKSAKGPNNVEMSFKHY